MHVLQDGKRALTYEQGCVCHGAPGSEFPGGGNRQPEATAKGERGGSSGRGAGRVCACNVSAQQGTPQRVGVTPRKASSREEGQREVTAGEVGARAGQTVVTEEAAKAK